VYSAGDSRVEVEVEVGAHAAPPARTAAASRVVRIGFEAFMIGFLFLVRFRLVVERPFRRAGESSPA